MEENINPGLGGAPLISTGAKRIPLTILVVLVGIYTEGDRIWGSLSLRYVVPFLTRNTSSTRRIVACVLLAPKPSIIVFGNS